MLLLLLLSQSMTSVCRNAENDRESLSMLLLLQKHFGAQFHRCNVPQLKLRKKKNTYHSHFYYLFTLYISPSGPVFSPRAPLVFASSFLFTLYPHSLARGEEDQSNPSVRFLSSPAPYQRSLCLSSRLSAKSPVD